MLQYLKALVSRKVNIRVLSVILVAVCASCTTKVDTSPVRYGGQVFPAPTAIRAISADNSIWLAWNRPTEWDSGIGGYSFIVLKEAHNQPNDTLTGILSDPSGADSMFQISPLIDDTVYTFIIQSFAALDGTKGYLSDSIHWAPARQFTSIQLYTASVPAGISVPTGLSFSLDSGVYAVTARQEPDSVDIIFSDSGGKFVLLPANLAGMSRTTVFRTDTGIPAYSLSDYVLADSVINTTGWLSKPADLNDSVFWQQRLKGKGLVYYLRTYNGANARIIVQPNANGNIVTRDSLSASLGYGYNYITVTVSYQQNTNIPYARFLQAAARKHSQ